MDYVQPPLQGGAENIPLQLFIKSFQSSELSKVEVKELIRSMYIEKYSLVNGINEEVLYNGLKEMGIDLLSIPVG